MREEDIKFVSEFIAKVLRYYLPYRCPACGEPTAYNLNDKGICNSCFLRETYQRLCNAIAPGGDLRLFSDWFLEHYKVESDD